MLKNEQLIYKMSVEQKVEFILSSKERSNSQVGSYEFPTFLMKNDPFCYPPSYEKLSGDLNGLYSRRINSQHRIVYEVDEEKREIHILRMWTHYDKL